MKKRITILTLILLLAILLTACLSGNGSGSKKNSDKPAIEGKKATGTIEEEKESVQEPIADIKVSLINEEGSTINDRVITPEGFKRVEVDTGSFGEYLRSLPLKPHGSKVKYYDGGVKSRDVHEAVIDIDVGDRDLQQCADAVMRLRAEYLYSKELFAKIHFNFTNGFKADYATWRQGKRIKVEGNKVYWAEQAGASNDYTSFRKYLDMVFAYSGTLSLSQEMKKVPVEDMVIGDVFLKGGSPGHCVIVLDMAENKETGEKLFIVGQSYMPAQDIHILKNPANEEGNPWYSVNFGEELYTPEWKFTNEQLMRFED